MSSILETFYILFKSNSKEVEDGTKKADSAAEHLHKSLTDSSYRADRLGESFSEMMDDATKALVGILAVGTAIAAVSDVVKQTQQLRLTAMSTGNSTDQIDAVERATKKFGGSVEETQGVLKSLNSAILDTAFTGEGSLSPVLRRLGLNLRNTKGEIVKPVELLDKLNLSFQKLNKRDSMNLGDKMGLSEAMILMLQQTPEAYKKAMDAAKKYGAVTQDEVVAVNQFDMALNEIQSSFKVAVRGVVVGMIPALTIFLETVNTITSWMKSNKTLVQGFFIGISAIISAIYIPTMMTAAAATLVAIAPLLAVGAIILAVAATFAILYDDVQAFAMGNKSVLGDAIKRWPMLGVVIKDVIAMIGMLVDAIKWFGGFVLDVFFAPQKAIQKLIDLWKSAVDWIRASAPMIASALDSIGMAFSNLGDFIRFIFDGVSESIKFIIDGVTSSINAVVNKVNQVKSILGMSGSDVKDVASINAAKDAINFAAAVPIASQNSNSISNSKNMMSKTFDIKMGDVVIETAATDAQGISAAVGKTLTQQMKQAMYNIDDGVSA